MASRTGLVSAFLNPYWVVFSSSIERAMSWWYRQLRAVVPAALEAFMFEGGGQAFISISSELKDRFEILSAQRVEVSPLFDASGAISPDARAEIGKTRRVTLLLPSSSVLHRGIELPLAARHRLAGAVSFLIEKISPIPPTKIYFSARAQAVAPDKRTFKADIAIISNVVVDRWVNKLIDHNIILSAIELEEDAGKPRFDFSSAIPKSARKRNWFRTIWVLEVAISIFLLVACPIGVACWLNWQSYNLAITESELADRAKAVLELRGKLRTESDQQHLFLAHENLPRTAAILETLAKSLEDDTWLFSLDISSSQVIVQGYTNDVPAVLHRLETPPFTSPELAAPILHGQASGKDRFEVRLHLEAHPS